jgi:hypothetical protein
MPNFARHNCPTICLLFKKENVAIFFLQITAKQDINKINPYVF